MSTGAATRVALVSGACVRHDAISYSLRLKLELLRSLRNVEVRVFVQGTDFDDPEIRVRSLGELLLDPEFTGSDVVVYEYGIAYELFDSLFALDETQSHHRHLPQRNPAGARPRSRGSQKRQGRTAPAAQPRPARPRRLRQRVQPARPRRVRRTRRPLERAVASSPCSAAAEVRVGLERGTRRDPLRRATRPGEGRPRPTQSSEAADCAGRARLSSDARRQHPLV